MYINFILILYLFITSKKEKDNNIQIIKVVLKSENILKILYHIFIELEVKKEINSKFN
jgi:hypothetical protein